MPSKKRAETNKRAQRSSKHLLVGQEKPRESPRWQPSKWRAERIAAKTRRIYKHAVDQLCEIVKGETGLLLCVGMINERKEVSSVQQLRALGVKLLGDK